MKADRNSLMRPFAIFCNGFLQGSHQGRYAHQAAQDWLRQQDAVNTKYFNVTKVEITVGHYKNGRIERLTTHFFKRADPEPVRPPAWELYHPEDTTDFEDI